MKKLVFTLATCCIMCACEQKTETNPFFTEFQTEYGAPDFDKIKIEHYEPAFLKGIEEQNAEIKAIVESRKLLDLKIRLWHWIIAEGHWHVSRVSFMH